MLTFFLLDELLKATCRDVLITIPSLDNPAHSLGACVTIAKRAPKQSRRESAVNLGDATDHRDAIGWEAVFNSSNADSSISPLVCSSRDVQIGTRGTRLSKGRIHALVPAAEDVESRVLLSTQSSNRQYRLSRMGPSALPRSSI